MATVTIGGTQYEIHELNFIALERAWPNIEQAMISRDPMTAVSAAIGAMAACVMEEEYFKLETFDIDETKFDQFMDRDRQIHAAVTMFFKRKTKANEIEGIRQSLQALARENGLESEPGEAQPSGEETMSLSTGASTVSSPSSLQPDAKEEAGTQ